MNLTLVAINSGDVEVWVDGRRANHSWGWKHAIAFAAVEYPDAKWWVFIPRSQHLGPKE